MAKITLEDGLGKKIAEFELDDITPHGATAGRLADSFGNLYIVADGKPVGSLWFHEQDGAPVVSLGRDPNGDSGWDYDNHLPLAGVSEA